MGLFDYRKSLYKNFNEELHEKEINRLNELDTSLINRWNTTAEKGINRINNMYIPSIPSNNDFPNASTVPLPKYGYSQAKRNEVQNFVPNVVDTDTDIKKYLPKRYKKTKDGNQVEVNYLDSLKNDGKKEANRLTKKVSDNRKNKLYTNVVEPLVMGGLIEPAADIGSIFTLDKEGKKEYNKNLNTYKDDLSGVGKVSNTIGSIGANIGMSNALGLDKLKLVNNKYLNSAIKEGLENTIVEGGLDFAKGNTDNFFKNRGKDFLGGAAFGVGANALGDMVRGIKNIDGKLTKNVNDIFDTSEVPNMDLDDNLTNINNKAKDIRRKQEELLKEKNTPNLSDVDFKYDGRTFEDLTNVGNRKVKSITENMYELKPFIQNQAEMVLQDMRFGTVGGDTAINKATNGRATTSRLQSEVFDIIKAQTKKSYAEIKEALERVARGEVNDALTKKIELILDDSLINGTRLADGLEIPANLDYIETKKLYQELSNGNTDVLKNKIDLSEYDTSQNTSQDIESDFYEREANIPINNKNVLDEQINTKNSLNIEDINETALTELEDKGLSRHKEVTAANSDMVTDEVKELMSKYELDYDIKHDNDVIKKAMEEVKKPKAVENFIAYDGKPNAEYIATGEVLFKELQSKGDIEGAVNILNKLSMEGTNLGQSMRMYRLMNSLTPEGKLMYAQRQIDKVNKEILDKKGLTKKAKKIAKKEGKKEADVLNELKKKYKVPEITIDEKSYILDTMKKANETTNEREKQVLIAQINKLISDKIPASMLSKIDSYRYINMLFNPKTLIKNFFGNIVNTAAGMVRDTIGAGVDNLVSKATGIRSTYLPNVTEFGKGFVERGKNTLEDYKLGIDTSMGSKLEGASNTFRGSQNIIGKGLEKTSDLLGTGLKLGDETFKGGLYNQYVKNYMKANNIEDISEVPTRILEEAHQIALEGTYQQGSKLADAIGYAKNKSKILKYSADAVTPFLKTPINMAATAIDYSPIGLGKGAYNIGKAISGNTDDLLRTQRKGVGQLASGVIGSGMLGAGIGLGKNGTLTGSYETDRDKRKFEEQTGKQTYGLNIGDKTYGIDFMQPLSTAMMVGADLGKGKNDIKDLSSTAINSFANNSFMSGITDMANSVAYNGVSGALSSAAENYLKQLLPYNSLTNAINRSIDPTVRETYADNSKDKLINEMKVKYPGLAQTLPQRLDTLGQPMYSNEGVGALGNIARNTIIPTTVKDNVMSNQEKKIDKIYNQEGKKEVFPYSPTGKDFNFRVGKNGSLQEVRLTTDEYTKYSELVGKYVNSKVLGASNSEDVAKIIEEAKENAKDMILKQRGYTKKKEKNKVYYVK